MHSVASIVPISPVTLPSIPESRHDGEANSIQFFNSLQIDYISCSPFRIPTAKLAAAQAEIIKTN